jgi:hypothetical protein
MSPIIREYSCRFLNSERARAGNAAVDASRGLRGILCADSGRTGRQSGYALFLVMMAVTLMLVALTAALPSIYMENQREKEEELIFRGNQYARAIFFFHTRFRRFPNSVDELLKTNGIRFLRKAYKDPMTKDGKWRFIHANAAGALLDSQTMKVQAGLNPFGGNPPGGSLGSTSGSPGSTGSPDQSSGGSANGQGAPTDQNQQADQGQNAEQQPAAGSAPQTPSIFGNNEGATFGSFIAGVASRSHRASVRVWNNKKHYDQWEFLGVAMATSVPPIPGMVPGTGGGTAGQPGAPGQPTAPTQPSPQQPVATPPPTANPVEPQPPNEPEQPAPEQPPPETEPPQ